ncbi:Transcription initiation factor TFIID subunit 10 [Tulasnella sp. JGI-2019a]|nr:Transcription initiation factor TFIID subunit 10 [Tulasnella sp. JGI-2019a]KAG8995852.1 Transcription initiation factor TFIID subunit 10 [Tulasnella sp. JGI-2019a]KAG9036035.1 Transcription initiation factor TFIID subunit 10 [Tulasnella sp. JGI-2019a]
MASPLSTDIGGQPSTPTAVLGESSQSQGTTLNPFSQTQSRRADELARKDRTLVDFMLMLDDYEPLIPNEVTEYYLQRVGFECDDIRLKRLLSLAAQKFVSDIASDAYQHARIRTNAQPAARGRQAPGDRATATSGASAPLKDKTKTILTMDDLGAALTEYGITARKPDFFL